MPGNYLGRMFAGIMAVALFALAAPAGATSLVFTGHTGTVTAAVFSPDGTKVLTGSSDTTAKLWNGSTGAVIRTFTGHTDDVTSVAFSPDGTKVLTGSADQTVKLWNASTGALVATFTGHTGWVSSVAFSPDGTQVLSGSWDDVAKLWNLSNGALVRTFAGNPGWDVNSVAFSPNGTLVLTAAQDGTGRLWNTSTGALVRSFNVSPGYGSLTSGRFSADGSRVIFASWNGDAQTWNTATGAYIETYDADINGLFSAVYSPNGAKVLTGGWQGLAKLWDVATGTVDQTFSQHTDWVNSVAFSPSGNKLLTGSNDGTARLETFPISGTVVIDNNALATNSTSATLALTWLGGEGTGVSRMRFSDNGSTWTVWEAVAGSRPYTLPAGDGYKTVRVQFLDKLSNASAVFSDFIRLDTVAPTGTININSGAATTTSYTVALQLTWADAGAGVTRMRFSDNGSTWTAWETRKATRVYTIPAGLGYHTVRVQYTDAANNYSPVYSDYIKVVMPT